MLEFLVGAVCGVFSTLTAFRVREVKRRRVLRETIEFRRSAPAHLPSQPPENEAWPTVQETHFGRSNLPGSTSTMQ